MKKHVFFSAIIFVSFIACKKENNLQPIQLQLRTRLIQVTGILLSSVTELKPMADYQVTEWEAQHTLIKRDRLVLTL
jgi:hypothetical protein